AETALNAFRWSPRPVFATSGRGSLEVIQPAVVDIENGSGLTLLLSRRREHEGGKPVDIISVPTFWTIWLLVHLILAVSLLGALTHQAVSVTMPVRKVAGPGGFVTRFRAVPAAGYATAVCVMWVLTFIVGSYIYIKYRTYIRISIEQAGYLKTQGFFDFKEHVGSIGLVLLPAYWFFLENS